jgi:aspartate kinase
VKNAVMLDEIPTTDAELASLGANVLHNRSVEMAKKYNVEIEVLSSFTKEPGTIVREVKEVEKMQIRGIARDNDVACIAVKGVMDQPGVALRYFPFSRKETLTWISSCSR